MTQSRLNHLILLHVHKDLTDKLDLAICTNDFVRGSNHRHHLFGDSVTLANTVNNKM